ncbi:hypothetical protein ACFQJ7_16300 [Halovenus rubra]|uniref:Uncharacterized protein n=2 Tax=Halovenus rubra TaxID=869890 RepID=A0ACC7DW09_9EURY|nr:hypothetical protein [Halovenus rubra]
MPHSEKPWSYKITDNVVIWDVTDWVDPNEDELDQVTKELKSVANRDEITASVTELEANVTLDKKTLSYIKQNNLLYAKLGLEKVGWVSDGIQGLALKSKIDGTVGVDVEAFDSVDVAVSWATE